MGLVKDCADNVIWIRKYGYKYVTNPVAGNCPGYERTYTHSNGTECLWVNVCFPKRKVYLYNEFECGGFLWEKILDIPNEIESEDEHEFIDWLDNEIG